MIGRVAIAFVITTNTAVAWGDTECEGIHSIFSPLPDKCLETIDTDRPHQTDTPHVVPAGHTQIESAIATLQLGGAVNGLDPTQHLAVFDNGYKFGLLTGVDLQLLFKHADYVLDSARFATPGPLEARMKFNLIAGKGASPSLTLVPTVFLPFSASQSLAWGMLVFFGMELPLDFELEVNAGFLFQSNDLQAPSQTLEPILASAITHRVLGPLSAFVDIYRTGQYVQFGTGVLMPIGRDVQIDAGMYIGVSGSAPVASPFIGFSVRR